MQTSGVLRSTCAHRGTTTSTTSRPTPLLQQSAWHTCPKGCRLQRKPLWRSSRDRRCLSVNSMLPEVSSSAAEAAHQAAAQLPGVWDMVAARMTTDIYTLAEAAAVADPAAAVGNAQAAGAEAVTAATNRNGGFFGIFTTSFEKFLKVLDSGFSSVHLPYSYGFSIIALTLLVKLATFPLTKKQVESTMAMQAIQPKVKAIQEKNKGRPNDETQMQVAKLYQEAKINPLAGCLPTLATLPVWIGLYRALSNVADEGLLTEGFFWIPSLAGPTSLAAQKTGGGFGWLFSFQNGAPPLGWHDTICYLVLPVGLVVSQYLTQRILSPPSNDPQQQQSQVILKFLPLMIGWFSLNVPAGLTLYWFTNNLLSTGQQIWLKKNVKTEGPAASIQDGQGSQKGPRVTAEQLEPAKPSGRDLGARKSSRKAEDSSAASQNGASSRGSKFRELKAREAAKKAAQAGAKATEAASSSGGSDAKHKDDKHDSA
ncbi:hypothetical protein WJX73_000526 [Symbiochloris irregularis]|uniref:Membrane insertase YidC/Oxa/ALB C-terminal domain-containing protein n=1 Tax=Symbiochloris irregularis TaxID=706552 RepID=A0AAW1NYB5_9CHLO